MYGSALHTEQVLAEECHGAGVSLCSLRVNDCGDKPLCKEKMTLIDGFSNFQAYIGQLKKVILVHCEKAAVPQGSHCMAHAGL